MAIPGVRLQHEAQKKKKNEELMVAMTADEIDTYIRTHWGH